jgi:hypothetical protein
MNTAITLRKKTWGGLASYHAQNAHPNTEIGAQPREDWWLRLLAAMRYHAALKSQTLNYGKDDRLRAFCIGDHV